MINITPTKKKMRQNYLENNIIVHFFIGGVNYLLIYQCMLTKS